MKRPRRTDLAALFVLVLLLAVLLAFRTVLQDPPAPVSVGPTPTPAPAHVIVSNDLGWHEVWRQVVGPSFSRGAWSSYSLIAISGNRIVMPVWETDNTRLLGLDTHDGQIVWTQRLVAQGRHLFSTELSDLNSPLPARVDSIFANTDQVYVALSNGVKAFQLSDGQPLWATAGELPRHTGYYILPQVNNGVVTVYGDGGTRVTEYEIDSANGQIQHTHSYSDGLLLKTSTADYYNDALRLLSVDHDSGEKRWEVHTPDKVLRWPVFSDSGMMIFAARQLMVIDSVSGQIIWKTEERLPSNFVLIKDTVYSLRENAVLVANDAKTGKEKGRLEFSNRPLDLNGASEYWVAADDAQLFVYLGDSQELIALERD
jgi:outer membrane protein assembly factor BamB